MTTPMAQVIKRGGEVLSQPPRPKPASPPATPGPVPAARPEIEESEIPSTTHDLSEGLPDDIALLKVIPITVDNEPCFRLEGYFRRRLWVTNRDDALRRQRRLGLVLADELDELHTDTDDERTLRCYTFLKDWSSTKYELSRWLTQLRRELGTRLRLIVWDDTDFGIAWELFWHRMDDKPAWLGTVIQMIRWTTVHDQDLHDQFCAEAGEYGGAGDILFYEDSALVQSQAHRICAESLPCPGYRQAATMHALLDALADGSQTYGVVYVRGHGKHHTDVRKAILAGVSLARITARELTGLRKSQALVFLNACNSARAVIDPAFGDGVNRNFAEVFLRQRAHAVIATMAEVPIGQSAGLARRLVDLARADQVRVPEYLQAQRARYALRLPEQTDELPKIDYDRIRSFLYVSMIVYFGHPDGVFRLGQP